MGYKYPERGRSRARSPVGDLADSLSWLNFATVPGYHYSPPSSFVQEYDGRPAPGSRSTTPYRVRNRSRSRAASIPPRSPTRRPATPPPRDRYPSPGPSYRSPPPSYRAATRPTPRRGTSPPSHRVTLVYARSRRSPPPLRSSSRPAAGGWYETYRSETLIRPSGETVIREKTFDRNNPHRPDSPEPTPRRAYQELRQYARSPSPEWRGERGRAGTYDRARSRHRSPSRYRAKSRQRSPSRYRARSRSRYRG